MSFPEASERTTYQTPQSGSITPTRTARTAFGGRGNPQPVSMADTVSSWRQPHDMFSRPASRRKNILSLSNKPIEANVIEETLLSPIHIPLSLSHSPIPTSPARSVHSPQTNNEVVSVEVLEDIRSDPLSFMTTFQEMVINDIQQVHSNIVNSFSSIEQKYTRYFNTVNNVLLTRPEYDTVQHNLDQFSASSTGITHRVMARSPSPLPTPNWSLHSPHDQSNTSSLRLQNPVLPVDNCPAALPPPHTRPQYTNPMPRYTELTTIHVASLGLSLEKSIRSRDNHIHDLKKEIDQWKNGDTESNLSTKKQKISSNLNYLHTPSHSYTPSISTDRSESPIGFVISPAEAAQFLPTSSSLPYENSSIPLSKRRRTPTEPVTVTQVEDYVRHLHRIQ
ncbi:hypothetical protein FB446DRAFT_787264 [Lentinula raphanica]|nr:hypothetical protein FB446DRAFT_787264 [Lentinula raphanica]